MLHLRSGIPACTLCIFLEQSTFGNAQYRYVKLGRTTDRKTRLRNLQTGNPLRLSMTTHELKDKDAMRKSEKHLLEGFKTDRENCLTTRHGGREWLVFEKEADVRKAKAKFHRICRAPELKV